MTQEEREQEQEAAQYVEMVHAYLKLTRWQRVKINTRMLVMLLKTPGKGRSDLGLLWCFVRHGIFPYFRPYVPAAVLTLAAAICWAWALATGAAPAFVAALAICAAAALKVLPLLAISESDEIE